MKMRNIPQCKLLIQAKQSKSSQGTEQLKAPEIVKQTLVYNFKQSKKKQTSTVNQEQMDVQGTKLKACEPSHLQNKQVRQ